MFIEKLYELNRVNWLNIKLKWLLRGILLGLFLSLPAIVHALDTTAVYTVKPGDSLTKIAANYGSSHLWAEIFEANRDRVQDPDVIHTGQKLLIPGFIAGPVQPSGDEDKKPDEADRTSRPQEAGEAEDPTTLETFRQAFNQVVKQEVQTEENQKADTDYNLDIGGLIINETRSKMGSDFYNVFYKHWSAPEHAGNFILTITEQPMPSMGSLVTVKVDNEQVFKARLQPRYAITEKQAKQAVAVTYYRLEQQQTISSQITSY